MILSDEIICSTPCVTVGQFRCSVDHPRFRDSGPIERDLVVFPRVAVWIHHRGSSRFVADPNVASIYNRGQEYTRTPLSEEGDRSDWFGVSRSTALALMGASDQAGDSDRTRPFPREFTPVSPALYARQRVVLRRLKAGLDEPMAAEEAVLEVVAAALRPAAISTDPPAPMRRQVRAHRELAMLARAALAGDLHRPLDLTTLAGTLGVSAWHLCRVFKAQTGMSLRIYRRDLRLRRALERLESGEPSCSRLAAELGFSSHSHFTAAFHGRFGCIPTRARSLLHGKERGAAAGALLQALRTFTDQDGGRLR